MKQLEESEAFVEPLLNQELELINKDLHSTIELINETLEEIQSSISDLMGEENEDR